MCLKNFTIFILLTLQHCLGNYWGMKTNNGMKKKQNKIVGINPRAMQAKCPRMELWMSCQDYVFNIWDGDGEYVFQSQIDGSGLNICYDPTQCYLFEMYSMSDQCDYRITMDGKVRKEGNMAYDAFRIGACDDPCPGKKQIHILSYLEYSYGDIDYTFHRPGQGDIDGTILDGNGVSFCIDIDECNIMARSKAGYSYYYIFDNDGAFIDDGEFEFTKTFGDCEFNCTDATLLISTNEMYGNLNITFGSGEDQLTNEVLSGGQVKTICIDKKKCSIINGKGKANYYFFRNSEVFDKGLASEYRYFGQCKTECAGRPLLDDTERGLQIVNRLATVSGMEKLADFNSVRYQAACWLIYEDLQQYAANDPKIVQRYVLSLIYLSTGGHNWKSSLGFMTGKRECDWPAVSCTNKLVTKLILESNNLSGTIVSEMYSLYHLDDLRLSYNHMYGPIPFGIDRLSLISFDISGNDFTGTIPNNVFLINGLESLDLHGNLFTGTIPEEHGDISNLSKIRFELNFLSGTIPNWITQAPALKEIHLQLNNLSGKIPKNWNLEEVVIISLEKNQLTGTVPSELFSLPSLEELSIPSNKLSGPIQFPKEPTKTSLRKLWLNNNKFTGSIPSDIAILRKLKDLNLQRNGLSGAIPKEIGFLKRLNFLRMENNNFNGTMPFDNCDNFEVLSADCSAPRNIICPCCTRCYGYFTISDDVLPCPSSILSVKLFYYPNHLSFYVENEDNQLITEHDDYITGAMNSCISPTDCMTITSTSFESFSVAIDDNILFDKIEGLWYGSKEIFGYASDGTMQPNTCDAYKICDRSLRPGTPQRKLFNLITRFSGLDIFKDHSKHYESLCWWLDDLDSKMKSAQGSTLNLQRYILALLYVSTGGDEWVNNEKWMTSVSECEWHGLSCDTFEGMIDGIDLSNNNLKGSLPSELGELRGLEHLILKRNALQGPMPVELVKLKHLKTLDLSRNRLGGAIHEKIHFLEHLEILDLSVNQFSSTLPSEIGLISGLLSLNVAQNGISGIFPPEMHNLKMLQFISVEQNLMRGDLDLIDGLMDLEHIDFSNNYFTGSLPLFGESQHKLKVVRLNNNLFSGGIPAVVEEITSLNELVIYSNKITGSLPSQLGKIRDISSMSVAYNLLKGTVPTEISSMRNLSLLHLHKNGLTGNLNHFNYSISSFISDCGSTEVSKANIICLECTECCNDDGDCITVADFWPKPYVKSRNISPGGFVLLFIIGVSLVLSLISAIIKFLGTKLPQLPFVVHQKFSEDSIYRWFLSSYKMAWFVATISVLFQTWLAYVFLRAGDSTFYGNLWLYSKDCPDSGTECSSQKQTTPVGWLTFVGVVAVFLMKDFFSGCLMFYESSANFNMRGIIAAMIVINITTLSIVASAIFLYATSISNIALIKDAVIVLFLNDVDEQILMTLQTIIPTWTDNVESNIVLISINELEKRNTMSEVMDEASNDDGEDNVENYDVNRHDIPQFPCDEEVHVANDNDDSMHSKYEHDLVDNHDETLEREAGQSISNEVVMAELNTAKEENAAMRKDYERIKIENITMKKDNEMIKKDNSTLKERLQHVEIFIQSLQRKH